jgi:nitrite reductase/ring-hydroxylating ferredoxin subunit
MGPKLPTWVTGGSHPAARTGRRGRRTLTCDHACGLWNLEQTLAKRRIFSFAKVPCGSSGVNEVRREGNAGLLSRAAMSSKLELCSTDDVAVGTALKVEKDGLTLAVFNVDGEFYVLDDQCTHGPGSLSEGYIEGDIVECNFHNGQFNIRTGEVVMPPCMIPMKTYLTSVENGKVVIEV